MHVQLRPPRVAAFRVSPDGTYMANGCAQHSIFLAVLTSHMTSESKTKHTHMHFPPLYTHVQVNVHMSEGFRPMPPPCPTGRATKKTGLKTVTIARDRIARLAPVCFKHECTPGIPESKCSALCCRKSFDKGRSMFSNDLVSMCVVSCCCCQ